MLAYADAHADTFYEAALKGHDPARDDSPLHINLPRMQAAGQTLQICSIFTPSRYSKAEATAFAHSIIDCLDRHVAAQPHALAKASRAADVAAHRPRISLIPWLEGASPLAGRLELLDEFYARGVRGIGLSHNHRNEVADGCGCKEPRQGLSEFGHQLVERMEAISVAVDCAHLPEPAFSQVMALAKRPPCISHTGCRALVNITRNADDAMLKAIAQRGGFVGIDFYPGHLIEDAFAPGARAAKADDVAAHVMHAVNLCGEEHVGFGSDFDGFEDTCTDLRHLGDLRNLEAALRVRGLKNHTLERIFSRNLLSYLGRVLD